MSGIGARRPIRIEARFESFDAFFFAVSTGAHLLICPFSSLSLFLFPPRPSTDGRQRAAASVVSSPALGKDRLVLVTLGSEDDDEELENASSSSSDSSSGGLSATSPLVRGSSDSSGGKRRRKKKRPLVILFGWLGARAKDLDKYAEAWQVRKREREREN